MVSIDDGTVSCRNDSPPLPDIANPYNPSNHIVEAGYKVTDKSLHFAIKDSVRHPHTQPQRLRSVATASALGPDAHGRYVKSREVEQRLRAAAKAVNRHWRLHDGTGSWCPLHFEARSQLWGLLKSIGVEHPINDTSVWWRRPLPSAPKEFPTVLPSSLGRRWSSTTTLNHSSKEQSRRVREWGQARLDEIGHQCLLHSASNGKVYLNSLTPAGSSLVNAVEGLFIAEILRSHLPLSLPSSGVAKKKGGFGSKLKAKSAGIKARLASSKLGQRIGKGLRKMRRNKVEQEIPLPDRLLGKYHGINILQGLNLSSSLGGGESPGARLLRELQSAYAGNAPLTPPSIVTAH